MIVPDESDVELALAALDPDITDEYEVYVEFPETMVTALADTAEVIEIMLSVTRLSGRDEVALESAVELPLAVAEAD